MSQERRIVIAVTLRESRDHAQLSRLASIFGRRGLDVLEAELSRISQGSRLFTATVMASPRRANTLLQSFLGLVDVVSAELLDHGGSGAVTAPEELTAGRVAHVPPLRSEKDNS